MRVTNGSRRRRKKILKNTSGFRGAPNRLYRCARQYSVHAMVQSYNGRKLKKRTFRQLWISRINTISRLNGSTYSKFVSILKLKNVHLNRKVLSQLSSFDPLTLNALILT